MSNLKEIEKNKDFAVLIVDNEIKICELIKLFLQASGLFSVIITAQNVVQAAQKLQNQKFDLMIIDHAMPGKTGLDFMSQLMRTPRLGGMKYILISGCLKREDVVKAMAIGAKNVLVKPFGRDQLLRKVFEVLKIPH